jgi:hypothetical protein
VNDGRPRRILMRQAPPLTAGADHVEDRVQHLALGRLPGSPPRPWRGQVRCQTAELGSTQIRGVRASWHTPHHCMGAAAPFSHGFLGSTLLAASNNTQPLPHATIGVFPDGA